MPVAPAAFSAVGDGDAFAGSIEIGEENLVIIVEDQCARGNANDQILAREAGHFLAHATLAALGAPVMAAGEIEQGIFINVGFKDY